MNKKKGGQGGHFTQKGGKKEEILKKEEKRRKKEDLDTLSFVDFYVRNTDFSGVCSTVFSELDCIANQFNKYSFDIGWLLF